jgi:hypothetical protein
VGSKRIPDSVAARGNSHDRSAAILARCLLILRRVRAGDYPDKAALSTVTGVSDRTVQRDLRMLREHFDAPLMFDLGREGFYLTDPTWRLDAVQPPERRTWKRYRGHVPEGHKYCYRCGQVRPKGDFYSQTSRCKDCNNKPRHSPGTPGRPRRSPREYQRDYYQRVTKPKRQGKSAGD